MPSERSNYPRRHTPHSALRTPHFAFCARAFTLIEMLTVIAIIGILAAILIPTVRVVMGNARKATASADVSSLSQAATAYSLDFGAFPPDQAFDSSGNAFAPLPSNLNPNECLMWYLTRTYSSASTAAGIPWATSGWDPTVSDTVFTRVNCGPYFDMKAKQKTDRNGNGYYEFMDPWGRPYMYRAYPPTYNVTAASASSSYNSSNNTTAVSISLTIGNISGFNSGNGSGLKNTLMLIRLSSFQPSVYNGTFTFTWGSDPSNSTAQVNCTSTVPGNQTGTYTGITQPGQYMFALHNPQTCDVYSLGPYGLTRAANMPSGGEWKPVDATTLGYWPQVWGTSADGNDINSTSGNVITDSRYQDNISNW